MPSRTAGRATLIGITCRAQHSARTFDGDFKGEINPLFPAIVQVFVVLRAKCRVPCGPFSHVLHGYEMFDLLSDSERVAAQSVLLDGGIEERDPLALSRLALRCFAAVDFGQCVSDGLCAAVEIVVAGLLGDLGEDGVDEGVFIAAALTARDDVEGDFDGVL